MKQYRIVMKRDFGPGPGFLIDGKFIKRGFVVTNGRMTNVMPGAVWFLSIADAMDAVEIFIEAKGNSKTFWRIWHARKGKK
jgi:hypothetical protein